MPVHLFDLILCWYVALFSAGMSPYSPLVCRLAYLIAPRQRKGFQKDGALSARGPYGLIICGAIEHHADRKIGRAPPFID